ncbi:MAG: hypothetical protein IKY37_01095 [Bacteroidaceae bacterium]|nr:hypothetical protein [Bacteroidaceae bacterium]
MEYLNELTCDEMEMLSPAERLMLLGIDPFAFFHKKRIMDIDEDEYNDDFDDDSSGVDEEYYEDYDKDFDDEYTRDIISYINSDDDVEEYDLAELADQPFLRAVLLYNHNKRKYYA